MLFDVFFYSALLPAGFFFGAVSLAIQYLVDKFSLMRLWGWPPLIGSEVAAFSRRYFFTAALITLTLISSYTWAQFPYDNVCTDQMTSENVTGVYTGVTTLGSSDVNSNGVVYVEQTSSATYCSQSWT